MTAYSYLINLLCAYIFPVTMIKFNKYPIRLKTDYRRRKEFTAVILPVFFFLLTGCAGSVHPTTETPLKIKNEVLPRIGYSVQVGAFSIIENAVRLTRSLQEKGFDAFYFFDEAKFYKVRFGNYPSWEDARRVAEDLRLKRAIPEYIIVNPDGYLRSDVDILNKIDLRKKLVLTAETFLGIPYYWGGVSGKTGFDCSGLTMAVYKLNGLDLPRTANGQWAAGNPVDIKQISEGDLVFFSTKRKGEVSHVGIYVGDRKFIHSPGEGRNIQIDSLLTEYFQKCYSGARTYFR
jgi:hypothetical protein